MSEKISVKNLYGGIKGKNILQGVNLEVKKGEVCVIMGPNGSGKSTLANILMGNPKFEITKGVISLDGAEINELGPDERAKKGLFLSFQYPVEIPGVTLTSFLRMAHNNLKTRLSVIDFHKYLKKKMAELHIDPIFGRRYLNEGFSGGEKKKSEILQMSVLDPKYAILDETDSGLDVDALRIVAEGINRLKSKDKGILLITHYNRILDHVRPDKIIIMINGRIVKTGGAELAQEVEKKGYKHLSS